ncbi:spermine synthase-like [Branchiostoma floridae x Branchiostoma japonicum]
MPAFHTLLDFQFEPGGPKNPLRDQAVYSDLCALVSGLVQSSGASSLPPVSLGDSGSLGVFTAENGSHATLRIYPQGLLTVDAEMWAAEGEQPSITAEHVASAQQKISELLGCKKSKRFPFIKRGARVDPYVPTADNKLIEYDFDEVVYEADSPYQNIKIMHSPQFGNMLLLDNDPNLAESDIAYTRAILGNGREDFSGKTVLILGGGDGGILHELRQVSPKWVTMLEIDQLVINAAIKHLPGICHDSMDQLKGHNYEVLVEDCIPVLEKYVQEGTMFDFVINDLTAIPISTQPVGDSWDFLRKILDFSMQVLKPTGRYYTQGNGANMVDALKMYEGQLEKLSCKVDFSKETVCVPSYHELWVFYRIWKVDAASGCKDKDMQATNGST